MFTVGVITASDKGAAGTRIDESGPAIESFVEQMGGIVKQYKVVPDERKSTC